MGVLFAAAGLGACSDDRRAESLEYRLKISEQQAADPDNLLEQTRKALREASEARLRAEWENRKRTDAAIAEARAMLAFLQDNRSQAIMAEQDFEKIMTFVRESNEEWAETRRLATARLNQLVERFNRHPLPADGPILDQAFKEIEQLALAVDRLKEENRALKAKRRN